MSVLFLGFSGELKTNQIELTSQSVIACTYRVGRTDESHCNFSDPTNLREKKLVVMLAADGSYGSSI
ncbi:hypothetical protein EMCRGX_G009036 [Ephydatia muelleri]